jgi:hypothetical protein
LLPLLPRLLLVHCRQLRMLLLLLVALLLACTCRVCSSCNSSIYGSYRQLLWATGPAVQVRDTCCK